MWGKECGLQSQPGMELKPSSVAPGWGALAMVFNPTLSQLLLFGIRSEEYLLKVIEKGKGFRYSES